MDGEQQRAEISDQAREMVEKAIGESFAHDTGVPGIVMRWVVVAEIMQVDGGRGIGLLTNADSYNWDALGLLHYGILEVENDV